MKVVEMLMPPMGESIMECTILTRLKNVGDKVAADDSILEVATDKVDTEVPCPFEGTIKEWLVKENDVVPIGSPVALIETEGSEESGNTPVPIAAKEAKTPENIALDLEKEFEEAVSSLTSNDTKVQELGTNNAFYSPLVQSIAREEKIGDQELAGIQGTGLDNRLTKNDILQYLANRGNISKPAVVMSSSISGETEIIEMDRMRKMIAQRMVESRRISAHVTSFIETDMTTIVNWRDAVKDDFRKRSGDGITFTPILIEAVAKAIKDYPMINVSVEGDTIVKKKDINIGMAVALPDGNLIVPVIHNADQYDLAGLAKKVNELARKARENKLKADDLSGGTYTISNIGAFSNLMGTPIIVQPQVAIMAFGAIKKKPVVIESREGDMIGIRSMMFISHSYDHRVVDGSLGGMFLKKVHDYLEGYDSHRQLI